MFDAVRKIAPAVFGFQAQIYLSVGMAHSWFGLSTNKPKTAKAIGS